MGWHVLRVMGDLLCVLILLAALGAVARIDQHVHALKLAHNEPAHPVFGAPAQGQESFANFAFMPEPLPPGPTQVDVTVNEAQRAQYDAVATKTALELQQFRRQETIPAQGWGGRKGTATLVNLNPVINDWFLLTLDWGGNKVRAHYHLENSNRRIQSLRLAAGTAGGSLVISSGGQTFDCDLWSGEKSAIDSARFSGAAFASLCGGRLYLRNRVAGHYTDLEQMTEFLRDNVWNGEAIVGFVRETVYQDAYRESGKTGTAPAGAASAANDPLPQALLRPEYQNRTIGPQSLGISIERSASRQLQLGRWYNVRNSPGMYASVMQPIAVSEDIIRRDKASVNALDAVEASSLNYLVAFDLSQFDLRYALGTDHPRVNWSPRVPGEIQVSRLPGPDGIGSTAPLVSTGMVGPSGFAGIAASFSGGFKREHGGFKWGELSKANYGSHYGFVESGVVFSKLQPGVATIFVLDDGSVHMKTWTAEDNHQLSRVAYARQNGVSLVELSSDGKPIAGALVNRWGPGNWSGSADAKLRTLRGGACLLQSGSKSYLVYGYFSTATPSAMASVFHAYGCSYAMNLDMNALEHTYLALYVRKGDTIEVQHLVQGMAGVDKNVNGKLIPRFVSYPDNRDFFYLIRRKVAP